MTLAKLNEVEKETNPEEYSIIIDSISMGVKFPVVDVYVDEPTHTIILYIK